MKRELLKPLIPSGIKEPNDQISLNKTSRYSNLSAFRLPAAAGRRTGDATFLKRPTSTSATGGRSRKFSRRVSWTGVMLKAPPSKQYKMFTT